MLTGALIFFNYFAIMFMGEQLLNLCPACVVST